MSGNQSTGARAIANKSSLYGLFILFIGVFSLAFIPVAGTRTGRLSRLVSAITANRYPTVIQASAAELAKLPPNMRAPVRCPRERSPVTVEL